MKKMSAFSIVLVLVLAVSGVLQVQAAVPAKVETYDQLVAAIRQARAASQSRVEQAVQQEKVREAWETGKLIDEHVLQHKERADYDKEVMPKLAADLGMSESELYRMLKFYRTYPKVAPAPELSWSAYRELLSIEDATERDALAEKAEKEKWTRDQIREEVSRRKAAKKGTDSALPAGTQAPGGVPVSLEENKLTAKPGKAGTYRFIKATVGPETGKGVIDLGFSNYYRTSRDLRFKEGAILEAVLAKPGASAPSDTIRLSRRTSADLYTYRAWVVNVLDGDTLKVVVDLGFGVRSVQTLRLRGLDCPELVSKEGKEAKAFVEKMLQMPGLGTRDSGKETDGKAGAAVIARSDEGGKMADGKAGPVIASGAKQSTASDELSKTRRAVLGAPATSILIKTSKSDKYDRYLADVFVLKTSDQRQATSDYIYLNNVLLQEGLAVKAGE